MLQWQWHGQTARVPCLWQYLNLISKFQITQYDHQHDRKGILRAVTPQVKNARTVSILFYHPRLARGSGMVEWKTLEQGPGLGKEGRQHQGDCREYGYDATDERCYTGQYNRYITE
jgi:hypothetical protein